MKNETAFSGLSLATPVLFIIFNRPETTQQVFNAIRTARPERLYIAADGPRTGMPEEKDKCAEVRSIATAVDWPCEVFTLFRDINLGCGRGPSTGITWFFEHETEGIILEDDCLPAPEFFRFCAELLERYRYDTRVMQIGGNNLETERDDEFSYRFSNLTYIWGWATWRRAWKLHDFHMTHYQEINRKKYLNGSFVSLYERDLHQYVFQKMFEGDEKTNSKTIWDYQWQFACKINSGLIIVPHRNLIRNLGFGDHGTNTRNPTDIGHDLKLENLVFPLRHPDFVMVNHSRDQSAFNLICTSFSSRFRSQVKNLIPSRLLENWLKPVLSIFS